MNDKVKPKRKTSPYALIIIEGLQRTPFSSARALGMSAEGLAEPQPQLARPQLLKPDLAIFTFIMC